ARLPGDGEKRHAARHPFEPTELRPAGRAAPDSVRDKKANRGRLDINYFCVFKVHADGRAGTPLADPCRGLARGSEVGGRAAGFARRVFDRARLTKCSVSLSAPVLRIGEGTKPKSIGALQPLGPADLVPADGGYSRLNSGGDFRRLKWRKAVAIRGFLTDAIPVDGSFST